MRKYLLFITLALGIALTGCYLPEDTDGEYLTTEEINALIDQAIEDQQSELLGDLTDQELRELILEVMPENEIITTFNLASFEDAVTDMIEIAGSGVIGLSVATDTDDGIAYGTGSGVIYKRTLSETDFLYDYYVVTNEHVIGNVDEIVVVYEKNGLLFQIPFEYITVLGTDTQTDLGVIKFTSSEDFTVIEFADSYQIELGDFVFALGNPLGFDYYGTVTMGVISGLSRYYNEDVVDGFDATVIQHDAEISPGNSGGALLDINGDLVGINFMKIVRDDVDGIGFAIPSNTVKRIAEDLEDDGLISAPYLGITTFAQINDCGMDFGVCISDVVAGFPADLAGIEIDDVIVGYLNEGMTEFMEINNFNDLREAILNSSVGESITLKYVRDGVEYTSDATILIERP
ncbi:Serine protease Do-like HtrA [Candidatus Izimaplasma bacterium HR1]|jgi:serine protease Do|uniref:S1C family serine protease n=1 Tax=Candidatus Izimoplasma sp. HR1 TaxID=1541959 RepID=UPI0004F688E6|nr:Serine protease Do-like HtrA [Candidatus Izimaplasma bacterium HR1]